MLPYPGFGTLHQRRHLSPQMMRALQVGGVRGVLAGIVKDADCLAGGLSRRLQLFFQTLELGFRSKILSHHRDQLAVSSRSLALTSTIPPPWNCSCPELTDRMAKSE
ncbi:hypothetical protein [Sinorhizobium meliloti]|uniref:hypothetical protein n=1 Tax=Rhizobium meliloti TaxID=382 RepID=UPI0018659CC4|nr:hypothetical protein [Sinorhizobium meliloti]